MIKSNKIRKNNKKNVILFYNNKENDFLLFKDGIEMLKKSKKFRQTCINTLKDIECKKGITIRMPVKKYFTFDFEYVDTKKICLNNFEINNYKDKDIYELPNFYNIINNSSDVEIHKLLKDKGNILSYIPIIDQ